MIVMTELASMEATVLIRLVGSHVSAELASLDQDARETSTSAWPAHALMKGQQTVSSYSTTTNVIASLAGEEGTVKRERISVHPTHVTMEDSAGYLRMAQAFIVSVEMDSLETGVTSARTMLVL